MGGLPNDYENFVTLEKLQNNSSAAFCEKSDPWMTLSFTSY